jgi:UDP-2,4-diacetamido-2,4,6-trideoxy-beta-L-altropyranose hydrolase
MLTRSAILLRADANSQIGTGHVMRCIALAQAWQDVGGSAMLATCELPTAVLARLEAESVGVIHIERGLSEQQDAHRTIDVALQLGADWVVTDGYGFGSEYQRTIQKAGLKHLVVDDYGHARHYSANLVLNQNASAIESLYGSREIHTRLLLGTSYAMLRREFLPWRGWKREIPDTARNVLVTMGGADPNNATSPIVRALAQVTIPGLRAKIVIGPANPYCDVQHGQIDTCGRDFELIAAGADMPALMAWADLAISAAGSTLWELLFMQVPTIAICIAGNQRGYVETLRTKAGVAFHDTAAGSCNLTGDVLSLALSKPTRARMAANGRRIVDGDGSGRVIRSISAWQRGPE